MSQRRRQRAAAVDERAMRCATPSQPPPACRYATNDLPHSSLDAPGCCRRRAQRGAAEGAQKSAMSFRASLRPPTTAEFAASHDYRQRHALSATCCAAATSASAPPPRRRQRCRARTVNRGTAPSRHTHHGVRAQTGAMLHHLRTDDPMAFVIYQ